MTKHELVNNIDHKDIKIDTKRCEEYGDNIWYSFTFVDEFRAVQAYYPIFFNKDPQTGQFTPVALFGFQDQENLFLDGHGWQAGYIPISVSRMPFTIGKQMQNGEEARVLTVNIEHPRVNKQIGQPLFLDFGGNSDYLESIAEMMEALHHGVAKNTEFVNCLTELELLEPFTLDVQLNDQSKNQMIGFYTINEEKLAKLSDEQLSGLWHSGYLKAIHFIMASQGNIGHLISKKNKQLGL